MVGTSTPFHSADGSAYTLFYGDETAASGAVGVAVVDVSPEHRATPVARDCGVLAPIGASYEVTRSVVVRGFASRKKNTDATKSLAHSAQGNIVLLLSGQNAARLLLNAVNDLFGTSAANLPAAQRTHEKEKEFYAAVFDSEPKVRRYRSVCHPDTDLLYIAVPARLEQGSDSRENHGWRSLSRSDVGRD